MSQEVIPSIEKFKIKKLTAEDANKYKNLRLTGSKTNPENFNNTFEEESEKDNEFWRAMLSNPDRSFYVAEEGNEFISTAGSKKIDQDEFMIMAVYTLPEFRGRHLAPELINELISEAKQKGVKKMSLHVNERNADAIKVYEKLGFKIIKVYEKDGKPTDSYVMEKGL